MTSDRGKAPGFAWKLPFEDLGETNLIERSVLDSVAFWWFVDPRFRRNATEAEGTLCGGLVLRIPASLRRMADSWNNRRAHRVTARIPPAWTGCVAYTGQPRSWGMIELPDQRIGPVDTFFHGVLDALGDLGSGAVSMSPTPAYPDPWWDLRRGTRVAQEKGAAGVRHVALEAYEGPRVGKARKRARQHFRAQWRTLRGPLREKLYQHDAIGWFPRLRLMWTSDFPRLAGTLEACRTFLEDLDPPAVLLQNEYGTWERCLAAAAREKGVPTVAVQHGVIHPAHTGYVFPDDAASTLQQDSVRLPLPDRTAVYGSYHKRILMSGGVYQDSSVHVTGHPKLDRLVAWKEAGRDQARRILGIDGDRPVVAWLTQTHGLDPAEASACRDAVWRAAREGGWDLVIKLHPNEDQDAPLYQESGSVSPTVLGKDVDLYGILAACDVVVTKDSTAGLEALVMERPVIVLNLGEAPDRVDYVTRGVAAGVYRPQGLAGAIAAALRDGTDEAAREAYLDDFFYMGDGRACTRIASLVAAVTGRRGDDSGSAE